MKEYGGYLEFETFNGNMFHKNALALNTGRNALLYLIIKRKIKIIYLPYFLCDSVKEICKKNNIVLHFYHIDKNFYPQDICLKENEWIYIVNFYGQVSNKILQKLVNKYKNVIIDNSQAYFQKPLDDIDTIYTCRKYFGVPDGAFLYTNIEKNISLDQDISYNRMLHLTGRFECGASMFYEKFHESENVLSQEPIKKMSKLTENLLHGIDYQTVQKKRTDNYDYLCKALGEINGLNVQKTKGAYMYPLLVENATSIRNKLLDFKIYIPLLWPNVLVETKKEWLEWKLAQNILPLPVDQRYNNSDMEYISELVKKIVGEYNYR